MTTVTKHTLRKHNILKWLLIVISVLGAADLSGGKIAYDIGSLFLFLGTHGAATVAVFFHSIFEFTLLWIILAIVETRTVSRLRKQLKANPQSLPQQQ